MKIMISKAVHDVFPQLVVTERDPYSLELARGICQAIDGQKAEGIKTLISINSMATEDKNAIEEFKAIPLYIAWLEYDADLKEDADKWLDIYYERNQDDPGHVLGRVLRIAYYFERKTDLKEKIPMVTDWLVNSEIFTNPEIKNLVNSEVLTNAAYNAKMPADLYAHVLELHAHGLSWQRNWEQAVPIWDQLMEEYYPHTITGTAAAMSKATYLALEPRVNSEIFKERNPFLGIF
jgi:endo-beta-N-acetylglucosaminidase D